MKRLIILFCTGTIFLNIVFTNAQELEPNPNLEELVIVFKTHFDIGYTDYAEAVVDNYSSSMIEGALTALDESKSLPEEEQFVWTFSSWPMKTILQRSQPEIRTQVVEGLKSGHFAMHALPFTVETEACDAENLARGLSFSTDISMENGLELPRDAKMTDVPSHSWILPTILHHAGVKFLHLGCNPASQSPEVPLLFLWEGPDGSQLMTMYWGKYYGTDLVPPGDWPFKSWLAIIHTNDNQGAPSEKEVKEVLKKSRALAPNARIRIGRMSDFYDCLIKESPDLPVVRGDMPDTWIHGYMSMPKEVKASRRLKKELISLEALNTQLNIWNTENRDISDVVDKANENILLFDEHTFGLAMSHGHSGHWAYGDEFRKLKSMGVYGTIEHSWLEKADRVYEAEKTILPNWQDQLNRLAASIDTKSQRIVVYNPLSWKRDGLVRLQLHASNIPGNMLIEMDTEELIPVSKNNNVLEFIARDIPPMGYKSYGSIEKEYAPVKSLILDKNNHMIENKYYKIVIDPDLSSLVSVIDKQSNRELVKQDSEYGFGNYMYERFSKQNTEDYAQAYIKGGWEWAPAELGRPNLTDEPYSRSLRQKSRISYEIDDVKVSAIMHSEMDSGSPHDYSSIITLYDDRPYVEVTWAIHGKPAESWPEGGWMTFPLNIEDPTFKLGRTGAIVDPAIDFVKGSNHDYCFINSGLAIVGRDGSGIGFSSPDVPGISLDRPGLWKYSGDFIPENPNVFFNLYNNQWSTNFTEWIEGSWSARFYIWSIDDYNNEQSVITPSEELRVPLQAGFSAGTQGTLPYMKEGLSIDQKGIILTAFGPNPYGEGTLVRLWEQAGNRGSCEIVLPGSLQNTALQPVNLRGEISGKPFRIKNSKFTLNFEPYKPYTFVMKSRTRN